MSTAVATYSRACNFHQHPDSALLHVGFKVRVHASKHRFWTECFLLTAMYEPKLLVSIKIKLSRCLPPFGSLPQLLLFKSIEGKMINMNSHTGTRSFLEENPHVEGCQTPVSI